VDAARALGAGELDVVIASTVWNEGLDIPNLESVVIAGAGKSTIAAIQRSGRGGRTTSSKKTYELWDLWDTGNWMLYRWSQARREAYEREAHEITFARV
jgi:superfamily II DNA or RNA helicase